MSQRYLLHPSEEQRARDALPSSAASVTDVSGTVVPKGFRCSLIPFCSSPSTGLLGRVLPRPLAIGSDAHGKPSSFLTSRRVTESKVLEAPGGSE